MTETKKIFQKVILVVVVLLLIVGFFGLTDYLANREENQHKQTGIKEFFLKDSDLSKVPMKGRVEIDSCYHLVFQDGDLIEITAKTIP